MTKEPSPRTGKACPACGTQQLRNIEAHNAYSRFADVYICNQCGVDEAFNAFFWKERAYALGLGDKIKKEWV